MEGPRVGVSRRDIRRVDFLIFVTVGNAIQGFDRLLKEIEVLRKTGFLEGEVLVQYGHSRFLPCGCSCVPSLARDEFPKYIAEASLVITHAGAGSIGHCIRLGKKPVVVPRRKEYREHVNDHQLELVRELDAQGRIYAAFDVSDLRSAIETALSSGTTQPFLKKQAGVHIIVENYLADLSKRIRKNTI